MTIFPETACTSPAAARHEAAKHCHDQRDGKGIKKDPFHFRLLLEITPLLIYPGRAGGFFQ
jgi:hypothetical protein